MGMSALLNEASALVAVYREKNKVIDAALAAAIKAAPALYKIFYVDAVLGDDGTGTGDKATPFKTVGKAVSTVPYGGGGFIYLADGQEFVLSAEVSVSRKSITLTAVPGSLVKPTLRNMCIQAGSPTSVGAVNNMTTGFLMDGSTLLIRGLRLRTADYSIPDSTLNNIYTGLVRRYDRPCGTVHIDACDIELGDTPFMRTTINGQLATVSFFNNKVTRVGPVVTNTALLDAAATPTVLGASGNILPAGATWLNDLLIGVSRDANGLPRNITTNIIL